MRVGNHAGLQHQRIGGHARLHL